MNESRKRTLTTFFIDVVVFVLFVGAAEPRPTGILWHEWLGIAFGVVAVVHIVRSWDWIVSTLSRIFAKQPTSIRFSLFLNILLFVAMTIAVVSGVGISREVLPNYGLEWLTNRVWRGVHGLSADLSVILVGVHIALHWKWILNVMRRRPAISTLEA
jgi:Domain of unknown function (DUF4405)